MKIDRSHPKPELSRIVRLALILSLALLVISPFSGCRSSESDSSSQTSQSSRETTAIPPTSVSQTTTPLVTTTVTTTATTTTTSETAETSSETTTTPTPTSKPTPRATPTPKPTPKPTTPPRYYLYVELGSYAMRVYERDTSGAYTIPVRTIRIAIGRGTMTPRGKFQLGSRERWHTFGSAYTQYATRYRSGLYIHAPLYRTRNIHNMIASYYTSIGTASTSGCLRMTTGDAYWIYQNCVAGTVLEIVSGSPRGLSRRPCLR